jgi:predicted enzyme related to lactoylglutathione lyase
MALQFYSTVLNVQDLKRARDFWSAALGFKVRNENSDWITLEDPNKEWARLALQLTDKPKTALNRLHFDLVADDAPAEVERLKSIGAIIIPWPFYEPDSDFLVMTDLEGNEFCVIGENLEQFRIRP